MDIVNKAFSQFADLFRSMTPSARLTSALLVIVTVVSLTYLFNEQATSAESLLMEGETFSASELREMEAAFGKANLHTYQVESGRIRVPRAQQSQYMAALADAGAMPAEFGAFMKKAATNSSFIPPNRLQQEAITKSARNHDLQLIINKMRGIEKCAVQIDEKLDRPRGSLYDQTIITASVSVQTVGKHPLEETQVATIRGLVASSVAGMKAEAVTVVDLASGRLHPGTGGAARPGGAIGDYADHKKRHETEWQTKISHVLSYIPGVLVTTNVELDPDVVNEQKSTEYDPDKSVVVRTRARSGGPADGSAAPSRGNLAEGRGIVQPLTLTRPEPRTSTALEETEQEKKVATTEKVVVREGRTPTRVTVSVAVPASYYHKIWEQQNPTLAGPAERQPDPAEFAALEERERKKIEAAVLTLLPLPSDKTSPAASPVTVSTFHQFPQPVLPEAPPEDPALAWLNQHWRTLSVIFLALVSLVMLRGIVNRVPAATLPPATAFDPHAEYAALAQRSMHEPEEPLRTKSRAGSSAVLRNDLADIVRDDPHAAVGILRNWIGNAS